MTPPVFAHGHLRLYLLSLLEERPRHGYELIQALSDRFEGSYAPSAGTIYPRLAKLEEEGLVTKRTDGRKTVYEITDAGRAELDRRRPELDDIESNVETSIRRLAEQVREGLTTATTQLRDELRPFAPAAKEFGESAKRFATETASQARQRWGGAEAAGTAAAGSADRDSSRERGEGSQAGESSSASTSADSAPGEPGPRRSPAASDASGRGSGSSPDARQAELALESFRGEIRLELREAERAGRLSASVVRMLEDELKRVHAQLALAVGSPRATRR